MSTEKAVKGAKYHKVSFLGNNTPMTRRPHNKGSEPEW